MKILKSGLTLAIFVLAISIFYFSNALLKVNKKIPSIVAQTTLINKNIDAITTKSIPDILKVIPQITNQIDSVQSRIPFLLKETEAIRKTTIPSILNEIESVKQQIPHILKRIDNVNTKVPTIIASVTEANLTTKEALLRVDSINKQIPEILTTIKTTNDSISNYMVYAKELVEDAGEISKNVGKNAGSGFLAGILSTPLSLTKDIGGFIFGKNIDISEAEIKELEKQVVTFLNANTTETEKSWANTATKTKGHIKVLKVYTVKGKQIKKLLVTIKRVNEKENKAKVHFIKNDNGIWSYWR